MGKALLVGIALLGVLMGTPTGSQAAPVREQVSQECESWADMIEATPDDYRMKMIGCTEGYYADNVWERADGDCAHMARGMWRKYHNLQTIVMQVQYYDPTCVNYDDGSWSQN